MGLCTAVRRRPCAKVRSEPARIWGPHIARAANVAKSGPRRAQLARKLMQDHRVAYWRCLGTFEWFARTLTCTNAKRMARLSDSCLCSFGLSATAYFAHILRPNLQHVTIETCFVVCSAGVRFCGCFEVLSHSVTVQCCCMRAAELSQCPVPLHPVLYSAHCPEQQATQRCQGGRSIGRSLKTSVADMVCANAPASCACSAT